MKATITIIILSLILFTEANLNAQMVTTIAGPDSNINDALVMDDEGNIYGSDFAGSSGGGAVYKLTPDGEISVFSDGYSSCNGLDFDSEGNLYVVDFTSTSTTHQIYKLNSIGEKTPYGPTITGASGIIFDPLSDTLYVSQYNGNSNAIMKLSPDGIVETYCDHSSLNGPVGMAFDDDNQFYVANFNDGEIYRVTHGGDSVTLIADIPNVSYWGVGFITYASGYLYATGIGKHKIYQISLDGVVVEYAGSGTPGLNDGQADTAQFNRPNGITTNAAQDTLYISDLNTQSVRMITSLSTWTDDKTVKPKSNGFSLFQNYPNPLSDHTTIAYELFKTSDIRLRIFAANGKLLKTVKNTHQTIGRHEISVDASQWPAGLYYYSLECDGYTVTKKMIAK